MKDTFLKANQRRICVRYNNVDFSNKRPWHMIRAMLQKPIWSAFSEPQSIKAYCLMPHIPASYTGRQAGTHTQTDIHSDIHIKRQVHYSLYLN